MEYEPWASKTGVKVVPAFAVFQTPPEAEATKNSWRLPGRTAKSEMRPEVRAGPMDRSLKAPRDRPA